MHLFGDARARHTVICGADRARSSGITEDKKDKTDIGDKRHNGHGGGGDGDGYGDGGYWCDYGGDGYGFGGDYGWEGESETSHDIDSSERVMDRFAGVYGQRKCIGTIKLPKLP